MSILGWCVVLVLGIAALAVLSKYCDVLDRRSQAEHIESQAMYIEAMALFVAAHGNPEV